MTPGRLQVTFDCHDPARLATFWAEALRYSPPDLEGWYALLRQQGVAEEDLNATCAIEDPTGARPRLFFQRVPEPKTVKNRVHLDVAARSDGPGDRRAQIDAEVARLVELGARPLRHVDDGTYFVVMQDPEGNEFCID